MLPRPRSSNDLPGEEEAGQESMNGLVFRCVYDNYKANKVGNRYDDGRDDDHHRDASLSFMQMTAMSC